MCACQLLQVIRIIVQLGYINHTPPQDLHIYSHNVAQCCRMLVCHSHPPHQLNYGSTFYKRNNRIKSTQLIVLYWLRQVCKRKNGVWRIKYYFQLLWDKYKDLHCHQNRRVIVVVVIYKFSSARCVDDDRIDPVNQVARKERQPRGGGSEAKLFEITQTDHWTYAIHLLSWHIRRRWRRRLVLPPSQDT